MKKHKLTKTVSLCFFLHVTTTTALQLPSLAFEALIKDLLILQIKKLLPTKYRQQLQYTFYN